MEEELDYVVVLQAEMMTLYTLVAMLGKRIGDSSPALANAVNEAFDNTEDIIGGTIHKVTETGQAIPQYARNAALELLRSLRPSFEGDGDPKHAV